jgi:hypothetical protein
MDKFVDRAKRFKAVQSIEFYIRTYDSLHINNREILKKNIDKAIQCIQRFTKLRKRDLVIVDKLLDTGLSLDSDCDEVITVKIFLQYTITSNKRIDIRRGKN